MFGRKQPAFTFENRRLEEEALAAQSDIMADTKGQERIDLPFGEPTPPPVEPPKATTPRPDPSSLFPRHDEIEPKVATATSPLLQLGTEETVGQAAPVAAPAQPCPSWVVAMISLFSLISVTPAFRGTIMRRLRLMRNVVDFTSDMAVRPIWCV